MPSQVPGRVELPHSMHAAVPNATAVGRATGDREIRVSVILQRKTPLDIPSLKGRHLSREEYAASYGASQADFDAVSAFARANHLQVDTDMIHQITTNFSLSVWPEFWGNYHNVIYLMLLGYLLHIIPDSVPDALILRFQKAPILA